MRFGAFWSVPAVCLVMAIAADATASPDDETPDAGQQVLSGAITPDGMSTLVSQRSQSPVALVMMPPATQMLVGWFGDADLTGSNDLAVGVPRAAAGGGEIRFWRGLPDAAWPNWIPYASPLDAQKLRFMTTYCTDAGGIVAAAPRDSNGRMRIRASALDLDGEPMVVIIALPALELVGEIRGAAALNAFDRLVGDVDDDGVVGLNDILQVLSALGATGEGLAADINLDGIVGEADLTYVFNSIGQAAPWIAAIVAPDCPTPCTQLIGAGSGEDLPPLLQSQGWQDGLDCDGDGNPDTPPLPFPPGDCDGDGIPDPCEILQGAPDCDENGVPDDCQSGDEPFDPCPLLSSSRLRFETLYESFSRSSDAWASIPIPYLPYPPFDPSESPHEVKYKCIASPVIGNGHGAVYLPRVFRMDGVLDLWHSSTGGAVWRGLVEVDYPFGGETELTQFCPSGQPWFRVSAHSIGHEQQFVQVTAAVVAPGIVRWSCSIGEGAGADIPIGSGGCSGFSWGHEQGDYNLNEGVLAAGPLGSIGGVHDHKWRNPASSFYVGSGVKRTTFVGSVTAIGGAGSAGGAQSSNGNGCCEIEVVEQSGEPEPFCAAPGGSIALHAQGGNELVEEFEWRITAGDATFAGGSGGGSVAFGSDVTVLRGSDPAPITIIVKRGCWRAVGIGVQLVPDPATHLDAHAAMILPGDTERVFAYTPVPAAYRYRVANDSIARLRTSEGLASEVLATGPPNGAAILELVGLIAGTTELLAIHPSTETVCGSLVVKVGGQIKVEFDRYPTFRIDPPAEFNPELTEGPSFSLLQNAPAYPPLGLVHHGVQHPDARKEVSKTVLDPIAAVAGSGAPATIRITVLDAEGRPKRNKQVKLGFKGIASGQIGSQGIYGPALMVSEASSTVTGPNGSAEQIVTCSETLYQDHLGILLPPDGVSTREIPFVRDPMVVLVGRGAEEAAAGILSPADIRALAEAQTMRVQDGTSTGHSMRYERTLTTTAGELVVASVSIDMLATNHTQFALLDKMLMGKSAYAPESLDLSGQSLQYEALGAFGLVVPEPGPGLLENEEWRDGVAKGMLERWRQDHAFGCPDLRFEPIDPANPPPGDPALEVTTEGIVAFHAAIEYAKMAAIVGSEVAVGMIPLVGDGYAIVTELWNYWGANGEIDKVNMILSCGGMLMDLANVFPPVGLAGNAMIGAAKGLWKCLKEFNTELVEHLMHHGGSLAASVKLLVNYAMQTYHSLPDGITDPVEMAIAIVGGTLERISAMSNSVLAIPMEVQAKVMGLVANKCTRQLKAISQEGIAHVETFLPDRIPDLMTSMVERHGAGSATDAIESIAERLETGMRLDGLGPAVGSLDDLSNYGGKRVRDSIEVVGRAAEEGFALGLSLPSFRGHA